MGIRSSEELGTRMTRVIARRSSGALCHLLHTEFPGIFGPTISRRFSLTKSPNSTNASHRPGSRFKMGQVLWTAVAMDDPPSWHNNRIEDTRLLPIILDLVATEDIATAKAKERRSITRGTKIVRLFRQAYEQGRCSATLTSRSC